MERFSTTPAFAAATPLRLTLLALGFFAFATLPFWGSKGLFFLGGMVLIQIVFALAFNLMFGLTGLVSFGQAAFFAVGAYASAWASLNMPALPFLLSLSFGGCAGAALAWIVGWIALRRVSGIYFAILTLALSQLVYLVIAKSASLGRDDGLVGIPRPAFDLVLFRIDLRQGDGYYWFILLSSAAIILFLFWIWHGRLGRTLSAIRQEPERMRFLGINVRRYRQVAFVLSGTVSALAGALMAPWANTITPMIGHWSSSALPILFCLLGGSSRFWGPAVGVIVLSLIHI